MRGGQRPQQGRLAGVGQADKADVSDQPELELESVLFARLALLGMRRRLVDRRREVDVAQPAAAATRDHDGLLARHQVGQQVAAQGVAHDRARRHLQMEIAASLAVALGAFAATARVGAKVVLVAVIAQHRLARVDHQVNRSAAAAVAAIRPATRNVGLASEGRGAVAAVTSVNGDRDLVEEHLSKS